jgi:hypothetical protein
MVAHYRLIASRSTPPGPGGGRLSRHGLADGLKKTSCDELSVGTVVRRLNDMRSPALQWRVL